MFRLRSLKLAYAIPLVALTSLAVAACGGGGSTRADTSKGQTQPASSEVRGFNHGKQDGEHRDRRARDEYAHEGVPSQARGHD
jgi:hypothetical protein